MFGQFRSKFHHRVTATNGRIPGVEGRSHFMIFSLHFNYLMTLSRVFLQIEYCQPGAVARRGLSIG